MEFLGKMSHELRTPLNFVLGFSDLLQQGMGGSLTPKQTIYLDRIQSGGRRLLSLVNDVLDIAQVDAGKSRLNLEPVILGPLIQEVLGLVQVQATQKRLKVITALDPWLPLVVADRFKLAQILHNLVGNAVKFTPDGGRITVTTRQAPESESGGAGEHGGGEKGLPSPPAPLPPSSSSRSSWRTRALASTPRISDRSLGPSIRSTAPRPAPTGGRAGSDPGPYAR